MTATGTLDRVINIIRENLCTDLDIKPETTWNDLDADSLDQIEIIISIEDEFDIEIPDEDAEKCNTVQDVVDLVERLQG